MPRFALLALVALTIAVVAVEDHATQASYSGRNGLIAFRSRVQGFGHDLWVMNPDGSDKTNITNVDGFDHDPSWSRGGDRLYYQSHREDPGDAEIWVSMPDGSNPVNLTQNHAVEDYDPTASPDSSEVAWARESNGVSDIWRMNADGSGQTNLTDGAGFNYDPAWGPTNRIAFGRDGNLRTMDRDGGNQVQITNFPGNEAAPNWSPDGSKIVFSADKDGNSEIYIVNADGSNPVRLTNNPASDGDPAFSPDGEMIAFTSDRSGNEDVWVMNADGSSPVQLTNNPDFDGVPDWQPIPLVGDVNCNGVVNAIDALLILLVQTMAGSLPVPAACHELAGNVICDDAFNASDVAPVLQYAAGVVPQLPTQCRDVAT